VGISHCGCRGRTSSEGEEIVCCVLGVIECCLERRSACVERKEDRLGKKGNSVTQGCAACIGRPTALRAMGELDYKGEKYVLFTCM
jgi:hypothetical protein